MPTLFVSDIHLSDDRPAMVDAFLDFLCHCEGRADALYILGDLFDLWLGDDDERSPHPAVLGAIRKLTVSGVPVAVLPGNRDFLLGAAFEQRTGCRLLQDPTLIELDGIRVLLMHGDTLCTDDVDYQRYRAHVRDPDRQRAFLAQPLDKRLAEAVPVRDASKQATRAKPEYIMDVTQHAVERVMLDWDVRHLIHGHTHRPAIHGISLNGQPATRIVLGDWYSRENVLVWKRDSFWLGSVSEWLASEDTDRARG